MVSPTPLPSLYNQTPQGGFTFNEAAKYCDSKPIFRLKLKRRSVVADVDTYDAGWTTISSYVLEGGLGDVIYGIDDQQWITGVTKIGSLDLELDNTTRAFNSYLDTHGSLWYDTDTTYYIANSLVELELGFELPTGTQYYSARPFHSGLIKQDSVVYNVVKNTVKFSVFSKLDYLKSISMSDVFSPESTPQASAISLVDNIYSYITTSAPSDLSLSANSNNPRSDIMYEDATLIPQTAFDFMETVARQTGSLFGINREGGIYLTYFGNPYYQNTSTSFLVTDSGVSSYYACNETGGTDDFLDSSGNGYDLAVITGTADATAGKFGSGREVKPVFVEDTFCTCYLGAGGMDLATSNNITFEAVLKFNRYMNYYNNWDEYLMLHETGDADKNVVDISKLRYSNEKCWLLRPYDSSIHQPTYKKITNFGENQWYYIAVTSDYTNQERNFYVNGTLEYTLSNAPTLAECSILIGAWIVGTADIELDSFRTVNRVLSEEEIKNNNAKIFGNAFLWASTSSYSFYNYGVNQNIEGVIEYDNGYNKIFNKIVVPTEEAPSVYKTEFTLTPAATTTMVFQLGSAVYKNYEEPTIYPVTYNLAGSASAVKNFINDYGGEKVFCTVTTSNEYTVYLTDFPVDAVNRSCIQFGSVFPFDSATNGMEFTTTAEYRATRHAVGFILDNAQSDFIFANIASVQEYGTREYTIEPQDNIVTDVTQAETMANAVLDNYAQPKIRIRIRCRYLEGDLDLFDRVTVHWRHDAQDDALHWDDSLHAWDSGKWGDYAGQITWETKDFWILAVNHSFEEQHSLYLLREV